MKNIVFILLAISAIFFDNSAYAANVSSLQRTAKIKLTGNISSFEEYCHAEINKIRQEKGLQPLKLWPELSNCAREHSQNMAAKKCPFGHQGFNKRYNSIDQRARLALFGENVAYNYNYENPVKVAVEGWMESDGHRENILANFEETGIGVAITEDGKFYITQLFATRD